MSELKSRMKVIAGLCPKCDVLFDIGCDHARISIELIKKGYAGFAVASDINKGPLNAASENAVKEGLADRMEFVLSDGFKEIDVKESTGKFKSSAAIITGMGGELIEKILEEGRDKHKYIDDFIFSPQSKLNGFRKYLGASGFSIQEESIVSDRGKLYFVIKCRHGKDSCQSEADYELGPDFFDKKNELKKKYLEDRILLYEDLCRNKKIDEESLNKYKEMLQLYLQARDRYEMS